MIEWRSRGKKQNLSDEQRHKLRENWEKYLNNSEVKKKTAEINKKRVGKLSPSFGRPPTHAKKIWYERLDGTKVCFRSSWELKFAQWLDHNHFEWAYEIKTFELKLSNEEEGTYTPDFLVNNSIWVEVKGRWTEKGLEKYLSFEEQYLQENILIVDKEIMKEMKIL